MILKANNYPANSLLFSWKYTHYIFINVARLSKNRKIKKLNSKKTEANIIFYIINLTFMRHGHGENCLTTLNSFYRTCEIQKFQEALSELRQAGPQQLKNRLLIVRAANKIVVLWERSACNRSGVCVNLRQTLHCMTLRLLPWQAVVELHSAKLAGEFVPDGWGQRLQLAIKREVLISGKRYPEESKSKRLNRSLIVTIPLQVSPPVLVSSRTASMPE